MIRLTSGALICFVSASLGILAPRADEPVSPARGGYSTADPLSNYRASSERAPPKGDRAVNQKTDRSETKPRGCRETVEIGDETVLEGPPADLEATGLLGGRGVSGLRLSFDLETPLPAHPNFPVRGEIGRLDLDLDTGDVSLDGQVLSGKTPPGRGDC